MKGIFYGVGVGPGDPELITLQAVKILKEADVILVPDTGGEQTALKIAAPYIEGKPCLNISTPMTRDPETKERYRSEAVHKIAAALDAGRAAAMITLGDPTVYSTVTYLSGRLKEAGYEVRLIPGIPSFTAAACAMGQPLCEGQEPLMILPASYKGFSEWMDGPGRKVLMKTGKSMPRVREELESRDLLDKTAMVENCTMASEKIYPKLSEAPEDAGYFSILIVPEESKS